MLPPQLCNAIYHELQFAMSLSYQFLSDLLAMSSQGKDCVYLVHNYLLDVIPAIIR